MDHIGNKSGFEPILFPDLIWGQIAWKHWNLFLEKDKEYIYEKSIMHEQFNDHNKVISIVEELENV